MILTAILAFWFGFVWNPTSYIHKNQVERGRTFGWFVFGILKLRSLVNFCLLLGNRIKDVMIWTRGEKESNFSLFIFCQFCILLRFWMGSKLFPTSKRFKLIPVLSTTCLFLFWFPDICQHGFKITAPNDGLCFQGSKNQTNYELAVPVKGALSVSLWAHSAQRSCRSPARISWAQHYDVWETENPPPVSVDRNLESSCENDPKSLIVFKKVFSHFLPEIHIFAFLDFGRISDHWKTLKKWKDRTENWKKTGRQPVEKRTKRP